jgi:hypothetical protein
MLLLPWLAFATATLMLLLGVCCLLLWEQLERLTAERREDRTPPHPRPWLLSDQGP